MKLYRVLVARKRDYGDKKFVVYRYVVRATSKELAIVKAGDNHSLDNVEMILADELSDDVINDGFLSLTKSELETFRKRYEGVTP